MNTIQQKLALGLTVMGVVGITALSFVPVLVQAHEDDTSFIEVASRSRNQNRDNDEGDNYSERYSSSLRNKINKLDDDIVEDLTIPVLLGVRVDQLDDTWGDARSNGRSHEGIDIMAPRGMFVVSPSEAVVTSIGVGTNGGNYVYTANPGGERFYYAHLDSVDEEIEVGDVLKAGDIIGYVGNTGNASAAPPHLHLGIYTNEGAINPYPRLTKEFTTEDRIKVLQTLLERLIKELKDKE